MSPEAPLGAASAAAAAEAELAARLSSSKATLPSRAALSFLQASG